ncbi:MAG: hypothetical protein EPN17_10890 [Methylobacter sp.]|nr:MAG: hypothetical protein EPN17_10890 [Methylobacter sp.]
MLPILKEDISMTIKTAKQSKMNVGGNADLVTTTAVNADTTAPVFASAKVNGSKLIMTYNEALDATNSPGAGRFAVTVSGEANIVTDVLVNSAAKTVTLTLSNPVTNSDVVTVGYTDPSVGNNINAIQDKAGNDAITIRAQTVINNTPDITAPVFAGATVNGNTLVMTYTEASTLDANHTAVATAFTVKAGGALNAVTDVAVDAVAKTVTLTLTTPVDNTDVVTVGYKDPSIKNNVNAIQDLSGNDALTIRAQTVINNTPDITAPVFAGATVNGNTLVMTYTEASTLDANHTAAATAFTVNAGGVLNAVTNVAVDAIAKTVTLTLTTPVDNTDVVTVGYKDPSIKNNVNAIQDLSGNDAMTIRAQTVINNTPDTTAPVFAGATVNGNTLVMTYTEASTLDATHTAAATAFTVNAGGAPNAVTNVAVDAVAKTVTLTLTHAVDNTDVVTVGYKDPSVGNNVNAIQDLSGNDALTIRAQTVINNTPDITAPVFASAAVNGNTLVMIYTEANTLDALHTPIAGSFVVMEGDAPNAVTAVAVDAIAKTVTLTLATAVSNGATVTVGYTDPSIGNDAKAIQDATGNDAMTIAPQIVINNTPDTTAPAFAGATVDGDTLVMAFSGVNALDATHAPVAGDFAVAADGIDHAVKTVVVDAIAKTVTLTLAAPVSNSAVVTVGYTDPSTGNDINAIQDATGNDAMTIATQMIINNTPDTTAPVFAGAAVNGDTLIMTYTGVNSLDATHPPLAGSFSVMAGGIANVVTDVSVDAVAKTVTLILAAPVSNGAVLTIGYTDPSAGNDINAIQDLVGNDAITITAQTVINVTPDTTAPIFAGATVNNGVLVMTYTETNALDADHAPLAGSFAVMAGGIANTVTDVAVDAVAKTVTLSLATPVSNGAVVTVGYTDPSAGNDINAIQDLSGNDAITPATPQTVINNTPDTTQPVFAGATVNGNTLIMTYTEATALDAAHAPIAGSFAVMAGGIANAVTVVAVDVIAETVTLTLAAAVSNGAVVTVGYTDPSSDNDIKAIQDLAGNDAITVAAQTVINNTPDTTAPVFAGAAVNGNTLVMTYNETLDAFHAPVPANFAVTAGGIANAVTAVAVDAVAKTVTLTLSTPVIKGNTVTVGYTDPSAANDANAIQDAVGNDVLSIAAQTVINNTPDTTAPVFAGAVVNGSTLVMTYGEALDATHAPIAGNFAVTAGDVANAVTAVTVNAVAKTVTLTLSTPVTNGAVVTVGYTDPSAANDINAIQDASGNDALSLVAQTVTNATPPVFADAAVNSNTLVMTYSGTLDATHAASTTAFAVNVNGNPNTVTAVAVDSITKTVTLTLSTAVVSGNVVTVGYTDPSTGNDINAIQDTVGNDVISIAAQPVTNTTAPVFVSAAIDGNALIMTYAETLDATHVPIAGNFAVAVDGISNTVTTVSVDAAAKTVTLYLTIPVVNGNVVTVGYTDPSASNDANAIQDVLGNDAITIIARTVTNNTPAAPVFASAAVNGNTLVMTYTEATTLDANNTAGIAAFAVTVNGNADAVTSVAVNATAKTVTLTLANPVENGNMVTVAYTDPTAYSNDINAIQNAAGYDAASIAAQTVTNNTPEPPPPPPVDNTAPTAPIGLDLASADDSGASNTDNLTNNTSGLTISGAAETDSSVKLYDTDGTTLLGTGTASGGTFSIDVALSAGVHNITAKATDASNNTGVASSGLSVTVDTTIPTVTTTSSVYNENNNTLTIAGTNFSTLLETGETATTDIKARMDWTKLIWDINGDDAVTGNVNFVVGDISSAKVTDGTHLTVVLANAKGTSLEATAGYGATGGVDTLDITAGFAKDTAGNAAITDTLVNGVNTITALTLTTNAPIITELMVGLAITKALTFTLTLDSAPTEAVTVNYATLGTGSAAVGSDFVAATGTVTFAAGQTVANVSIVVNDDATPEADETVAVQFSGASLTAPVTGTGTILANDTVGTTVALTGAPDSTASLGLAGSDDTISSTIDQNTPAAGTLQAADIFNGGAGTDRLTITPLTAVALTLDDLLFAGVTGMDKIVLNTTTTGAQTITTGANFNAAFNAAGMDLQTTSTSGAMAINTSSFAGATTLTVITTTSTNGGAGNSITTGTGVATVTATSTTGPLTINSADSVFATVEATSTTGFVHITTGSGADVVTVTTGNAGIGVGGNVITTGAGADTINVSATTATTDGNHITGGFGADTIILTGNTSPDTIVIGNTDSGITAAAADSITGFATGIDFLKMGTVADATPASGNYIEAVADVVDFAAALSAANSALTTLAGTSSATELYAFQWVAGTNGYLFNDIDGNGTADQVVVLVGIVGTTIAAADVIA